MARWPREPEELHRWEQGENYALVLEFNPHVIGVELGGAFNRHALDVVVPPIERLFERSSAAHIFWDAESLESHDGESRDTMVGLLRRQRSRWQGLHVLYKSALIGMTVGAVGLLFRGALKGYRDHEKFSQAVAQALSITDALPG